MNLILHLPDPRAKRNTVLKVKCFKGGLLDWNKWGLSWCTARKKFQEGMPLLPLGLSLRNLSRRRARFPSFLMLKGEFPSLSTMGDLWPSMVLGCLPSMYLTSTLARPQGQEETALKVKCFKEAYNWFKMNLVNWCKTRERFQEGVPLRPLGLSQWKLSRRRVRFSSLLTLMGKFPRLSAMADL